MITEVARIQVGLNTVNNTDFPVYDIACRGQWGSRVQWYITRGVCSVGAPSRTDYFSTRRAMLEKISV